MTSSCQSYLNPRTAWPTSHLAFLLLASFVARAAESGLSVRCRPNSAGARSGGICGQRFARSSEGFAKWNRVSEGTWTVRSPAA